MEQFNPCLRNFVAMGKNYEKALASKFFFSDLFSLCFSLQVQALGQGLCVSPSLSPDLATCGPFCFAERMIFILLLKG